jgi:hypothetical protein
MDVKASPAYRSCSIPFPLTSLSFWVSLSATSLGSWLLLGNTAYGYSQTLPLEEPLQATTDAANVETTHSDNDFGSENSITIAEEISSPDGTDTATPEFIEIDPEESIQIASSSIVVESFIANEVPFEVKNFDEIQSLEDDPEPIDLVQAYDSAIMQEWAESSSALSLESSQASSHLSFQEPFIEIAEPRKSINAESELTSSSNWVESIEAEDITTHQLNHEASSRSDTDLSQTSPQTVPPLISQQVSQSEETQQASNLGEPIVTAQGVYLLEGGESSARARLSASYALTPNVLFGATVDVTTGDAFTDSPEDGVDLNELFVTVSPPTVPSLRLTLGMIDLTSYFDRNSFAKDAATHFFNPVFQTNPALAAAGIGSRPGVLVNWDLTDNLSVRGAAFSSDRDLDDFAFDGAAAEVALRMGNLIVRGTYATDRDAGQDSGFNEIFQFQRGNDDFGLQSDDREIAYGVNAEYFIPEINLGLFARYGWYENQTLDRGGNTYSVGLNALDLFFADDRLGLGYGRALSNDSLRRDRGDDIPDVWELFYDVRLTRNFRAGVSLQAREAFSETVAGLRIRADFNLSDLWR